MDWFYWFQAAVLGIVEGLTEFLPVSSTGHLIIAADAVGFAQTPGSDTFVIAIQAGAILAVCWYYRARILSVLKGLFSEPKEQRLAVNTIVAFLPAAVIGVLVAGLIKAYLFNAVTVAVALVVGGLLILWIENRQERLGIVPRVATMDDMTWKDALAVGFWDEPFGRDHHRGPCSGALAKGRDGILLLPFDPDHLRRHGLRPLEVPRGAAHGEPSGARDRDGRVLLLVLRYVSTNNFKAFGWYRILFGVVILVTAATGWVSWEGGEAF